MAKLHQYDCGCILADSADHSLTLHVCGPKCPAVPVIAATLKAVTNMPVFDFVAEEQRLGRPLTKAEQMQRRRETN